MASFGIEPSAETRALAKMIRETFIALIDEGFTDQQAIQFLGVWSGNVRPQDSTGDDKAPDG